jgi:predicted RNA binding protein YcfA (HicA-like mRNA interferase family)
MSRYYPLTCKEVKKILKNLGFTKRKPKGTSHEQWVKTVRKNKKDHLYKVTVDCPKAPFSQDLIKSMASQAGVSKKDFYKNLNKRGR